MRALHGSNRLRALHGSNRLGSLVSIENALGRLFRDKLPAMSPSTKATVARIAPWVFIVTSGFALLLWLAGLGAIAVAGALAGAFGVFLPAQGLLGPIGMYLLLPVGLLATFAGGILMLGRRATGWYLVFFGELISGLLNALSLSLFGLLFTGVVLWALYNIRENFTRGSSAAATASKAGISREERL